MLFFQSFRRVAGALSVGIAGFLALPILWVAASLLQPGGDAWRHIAATVLPAYVANTAILVALVAGGVLSIGVLSAWLIASYRFPGARVLEWALVLPLAMPAYVMAYAYTDWLQFTGPVQSALRALTGWEGQNYWFPEIRSLGGAAVVLALALYPYV
ncbi:MAG: ABC transporter permease, partial [Burkholderiales bacterium]